MNREKAILGLIAIGGAFIVPELVIEFIELQVYLFGEDCTSYVKWGLTILMTMYGGRTVLGSFGSSSGKSSGGMLGGLLGRFTG